VHLCLMPQTIPYSAWCSHGYEVPTDGRLLVTTGIGIHGGDHCQRRLQYEPRLLIHHRLSYPDPTYCR
jgi:hypothetical protein